MRTPLVLTAWLLGAVCAALGAGCYRPDYTGPYACSPQRGAADCPDGWSCSKGLCVAPGTQPDLGAASGCAGSGTLLAMAHGEQVWACPGSFPPGGYATLCATSPGSHVCGHDLRDEELLALVDCDQLSGFYLSRAEVSIEREMMGVGYEAICEGVPGVGERGLLGCGTVPGGLRIVGQACHGLHHALRCGGVPAGEFTCSPQQGISDAAHTTETGGGVLCCSGMPRQ